MYKFVALCALIACSLAAPTDKPIESDTTFAADVVVTEKSLSHDHEVVSVKTFSSDRRDKREDDSVPFTSTNDNKRTPSLSQPDYQENKPPTFVHPVPVDQIIKHSNASPEIHSSKHVEEEREEEERVEHSVEENVKSTNEDEDTEQHPTPKPKRVYHKHSIRTHHESDDESDNREEN